MTDTYLGFSRTAPYGTAYNTGDGLRMAAAAGADMWHMDVYEGAGIFGFLSEPGERGTAANDTALFADLGSGEDIDVELCENEYLGTSHNALAQIP